MKMQREYSKSTMVFEMIAIENGDILGWWEDWSEAVDKLRSYVDTHRLSHPGIEDQVALLATRSDGRREGPFVMYRDVVEREASSVFSS